MSDCIFCKIAAHESPAQIEFENDSVIAFPSIKPAAETHILIVPKVHIDSFLDLQDSNKDMLMQMAKAAQQLIKDKNITEGYKLIFNGGKYQAIPHIHWHLLAGDLHDNT